MFQAKSGDTLVSNASVSKKASVQKHEQSKIEAIREDVEFLENEAECKCISQMDKHEGNSVENVLEFYFSLVLV